MIVSVRIDDRLIHGQVTVGCASCLKLDRIALIDDKVSADRWECELCEAAIPPGMEVSILSVSEALGEFEKLRENDERVMLLFRSPKEILGLIDGGVKIDKVNVGGMHFEKGKRKLLPYLYVSEEDESDFRELIRRGVSFYCYNVPGNQEFNLEDIL